MDFSMIFQKAWPGKHAAPVEAYLPTVLLPARARPAGLQTGFVAGGRGARFFVRFLVSFPVCLLFSRADSARTFATFATLTTIGL